MPLICEGRFPELLEFRIGAGFFSAAAGGRHADSLSDHIAVIRFVTDIEFLVRGWNRAMPLGINLLSHRCRAKHQQAECNEQSFAHPLFSFVSCHRNATRLYAWGK